MNIEKNKEHVNVPTPSPEPQMEDLTSNREISQRPEEQVASDDSSCVSSDEQDLQQTPAGPEGTSPYGQILEHLTGKARRNFKRKMRRKRLELHMKALKSENASADPTPVSWGPRGGPPGSTIYVNRPRYTRGSMNASVPGKASGDPGRLSWGPRGGPPGSTIYINRPRYTPASSYTRGPMKRQADRAARKQPIVLPTEPASRREESVPSGRWVQEEPDSTRRSPDLSTPSVRTSGTRRYRTPSSEEEEPASSERTKRGSPTHAKARSAQDKTDYAERSPDTSRPSVSGTVRRSSVNTRDTRQYRTPSPEEEEPASSEWRRRGSPTHPEARWNQDKTDYAKRSPDTSRPSMPGTVRQPSVSTRVTRQYGTPSPVEKEPMRSGWTSCGSVTHPEARWDQNKTDYAERLPDTSGPSVSVVTRQPSSRQYRTPSPEEEEPASSGWTRCGNPTHPKARCAQEQTDYAKSSTDPQPYSSRINEAAETWHPSVSTKRTRYYRTPSPEEVHKKINDDYPPAQGSTSAHSVAAVARQPSVSTEGRRYYRTPSPEEVNDDYPISRQSTASTSQPIELQVVIRSDRSSGLVLPDEAERIRAYVVEESLRAMEEDGVPVLRFLNSGRIDIGWFLVIAYDVGTWDWLLTRLPPLAIGEQVFWPVRVAYAPWPVRVGFRVRTEGPLCQERLERMLRLQNPTFNVREWMFLGAADEGREGECLVTFLISQEEAALLDQAGWTLFYELGAVTVQRLTVHGRDAVQDPSGADRRSE